MFAVAAGASDAHGYRHVPFSSQLIHSPSDHGLSRQRPSGRITTVIPAKAGIQWGRVHGSNYAVANSLCRPVRLVTQRSS